MNNIICFAATAPDFYTPTIVNIDLSLIGFLVGIWAFEVKITNPVIGGTIVDRIETKDDLDGTNLTLIYDPGKVIIVTL